MVSRGKIEKARDEIERILSFLNHVIQESKKKDNFEEINFTIWHLDNTINILFYELFERSWNIKKFKELRKLQIKNKLIIEDLQKIRQKLTEIQGLFQALPKEEARIILEGTLTTLNHTINDIENQEASKELFFASWHLERAIRSLLNPTSE